MACVNGNAIFDSFICNVQDCPNKISNNSIILNCFHSICSAHIQGTVVSCREEPCYSFSQNNPGYASLPTQQHKCVNVVNSQLANQLLCLYSARMNGAKCGLCGVHEDGMQLCIDCPSVFCNTHREGEAHTRFGTNHVFASLQLSNETIINLALNKKITRRADNDELEAQINAVKRNKEHIDNKLAELQLFMDRVHNNTRDVIEEANADFEKILRHIETMKNDLFESLNNKSDELLKVHQEMYRNLEFKSSAAERALVLCRFVKKFRIRVTDKFVRMLSNDSLSFAQQLYPIHQPPIEFKNIPRILHIIQENLEFLHPLGMFERSIPPPPPTPCHATYYFKDEKDSQPTCKGVESYKLMGQTAIHVRIDNFPNICRRSYIIYHDNQKTEHKVNQTDNRSCNVIPVLFGDMDIAKITKIVCFWNADDDSTKKIPICVLPNRLSIFSLAPAKLSGVAKSGDKLFGISQNGKEILRLDCPPELISNQMDKEKPSNLTIEEHFGLNHLTTPKGICVLRGQVYVSDESQHAVFCFSDDATFLVKLGGFGIRKGHFNKPMGLTGDQENGRIIVADSGNCRVQIFRPGLNQDWEHFTLREDVEEDFPIDVKLDTLGSFYVLTHSRAILCYDSKFNFRTAVLHADTIVTMPFFAIDASDIIYVCTEIVRPLKESEYTVCTIRCRPNNMCNFNTVHGIPKSLNPAGLTVDEEGRLYLTHHETNDPGLPSTLVYIVTQNPVSILK